MDNLNHGKFPLKWDFLKKNSTMDRESTKKNAKKENSGFGADIGYVFQSFGIRCPFRFSDEMDGILSGNRYYILLHLNFIFLYLLDYVKEKC
jgi:hypothetical protein